MSNNSNLQNKVERILKAIDNDQVAKHYFYTKPDLDEIWFDALNTAGAFDIKPISLIKKVGDQIEYYRWVEAEYLIKISPIVPDKILTLISGYDTASVENPIIKEKLLEIICILVQEASESSVTELVIRLSKEKWFESRYLNLMVYKLEDLVKVLCEKKYYGTLIELLPGILKLQKPSEDSKYKHDPVPLFESYTYQAILNHIAKLKFKVDQKAKFKKILTIILNLLQDHIQIDNNMRSYRKKDDDTSVVWKPDISSNEPDPHKDLDESLLDVARDLILFNLDLVDEAFIRTVVSKNKYSVFKRLALFTLVQSDFAPEKVYELIKSCLILDNVTTELREVLKKYFKMFSTEQKNEVLNQIEDMYDLDKLVEEKQFLLEDGRAKNEEDLRSQLTVYATRKKSEYLLPIAEDLTKKQKEHFKEVLLLKDDYRPPYISSKGGFRSGPNSRLSIEEIKSSSIEKLVKKFKDDAVWFIDHTHNEEMYSPLGIARAWDPDIKDRPEEYLSNLKYFKPDKLLPPVYIYHLFNGFEAALKDKKVDLSKLMTFLNELLQQYKDETLPEFPVKDDFDIGGWDEVLIAILRFFDDTLQIKGAIKVQDEQTVLNFIEFCLNYKSESEIKDEEERYSSKDYYTHSINSLYGLALHCSIRHAVWRVNEEIAKQSLTDDMKKLIEEQLNRKVKTAFSVYGHYYPTIFYYDRTFGKKIKPTLFDNEEDGLKYAAFESFLFNNVYKEIVDEIKDSYAALTTNIDSIPRSEHGPDIKEKLVEHLMISYVHELPGAEELKVKLFEQEERFREHAISFVGRAYVSAERKKPTQAVVNKIKNLWKESLEVENLTYGKSFGWWLNSTFFADDDWMLEMFIKTLEKTNGVIDPDFKVLRTLADLSKDHPEKCLTALLLMVNGKDKEKTYYFRDQEVLEIIENGEAKNEQALNETAEKIRNELVKYGFLQYKK
jgi:hypothetical protein